MLVPKLRPALGLTITGLIFLLPLSSCESGGVTDTPGTAGAFASAGAPTIPATAGAGLASAGSPTTTPGGAGGAPAVAGAPAAGGVDGLSGSGGTGGAAPPPCTDIQAPDHPGEPCSQWPEWDAADPSKKNCEASWLTGAGYCLESCGKCKSANGTGGSGAGGGSGGVFNTGLGPGPMMKDIPTSNKIMWASRYWDCCKPHCSTNGNIKSCGADGVSQNGSGSACSGGQAYTCYSQAPRAIGDYVAYGYVAVPNPQCGTCYHLQFTGTGQFSANDPGSKQLLGKHMIVKVSNTGGDVA